MTPYLDGGFLLTLVVKTTGSATANRLVRGGAPFPLNFLHQLQAENLLVSLQDSQRASRQTAGREGMRLWRYHLAEGVFQLTPTDWDTAFRLAIRWNMQVAAAPPPWLLLHPALAATVGATDFFSFDPRSRAIAKTAGLKLVPDRI
jgi:hypothetical protein